MCPVIYLGYDRHLIRLRSSAHNRATQQWLRSNPSSFIDRCLTGALALWLLNHTHEQNLTAPFVPNGNKERMIHHHVKRLRGWPRRGQRHAGRGRGRCLGTFFVDFQKRRVPNFAESQLSGPSPNLGKVCAVRHRAVDAEASLVEAQDTGQPTL